MLMIAETLLSFTPNGKTANWVPLATDGTSAAETQVPMVARFSVLDALETYVPVVVHSSALNAIEIPVPAEGHIFELQIGLMIVILEKGIQANCCEKLNS